MIVLVFLQEVHRLVFGLNCGKALKPIDLPKSAKAISSEHDFDLKVGI